MQDELRDLDTKVGDLESLNLFGVDVSADKVLGEVEQRRKGTKKEHVKNVLNDLVQLVAQIDPSGDSRDYTKRKSFLLYDPYNPESSSAFASLRYEDSDKLRASLVIQQHIEALTEITEEI